MAGRPGGRVCTPWVVPYIHQSATVRVCTFCHRQNRHCLFHCVLCCVLSTLQIPSTPAGSHIVTDISTSCCALHLPVCLLFSWGISHHKYLVISSYLTTQFTEQYVAVAATATHTTDLKERTDIQRDGLTHFHNKHILLLLC